MITTEKTHIRTMTTGGRSAKTSPQMGAKPAPAKLPVKGK